MASSARHSTHQSNGNRQFWAEFFALYESLPALWDARNPLYKERHIKSDGYELLVTKMREIEPNACREDVLRKINIFRTNFRRECARINSSHELGKRYRTSLWYFDLLNFLQSQESRSRERKCQHNEEKSILRRKRAKATPMRILRPAPALAGKHLTLKDDLCERASAAMKYENYNATSNESEEHAEHMQYTDEKTFQQQFQHQFHTLSFDRVSSTSASLRNAPPPPPTPTAKHRQSLDDATDDDEVEIVEARDADADAAAFHEFINLDESAQAHEILEEIEEEEELCGKMSLTPAPLAAVLSAKQPAHMAQKKLLKPQLTGASRTHRNATQPEQCAGGERAISAASEILAKSWAIQYEEMSAEQRIYARKAIAEILFEGCLGNLGKSCAGQRTMTTVVHAEHYEAAAASASAEEDANDGEKVEQVEEEDVEGVYLYAADGAEMPLHEIMN